MGRLLYNLHQGSDSRWRWIGVRPGTDYLIVSYRSWADRRDAQEALAFELRIAGQS